MYTKILELLVIQIPPLKGNKLLHGSFHFILKMKNFQEQLSWWLKRVILAIKEAEAGEPQFQDLSRVQREITASMNKLVKTCIKIKQYKGMAI